MVPRQYTCVIKHLVVAHMRKLTSHGITNVEVHVLKIHNSHVIIYCIVENFGGGKLWRIWRIVVEFAEVHPPKVYCNILVLSQITHMLQYYTSDHEISTGILKYFKLVKYSCLSSFLSFLEPNGFAEQESTIST